MEIHLGGRNGRDPTWRRAQGARCFSPPTPLGCVDYCQISSSFVDPSRLTRITAPPPTRSPPGENVTTESPPFRRTRAREQGRRPGSLNDDERPGPRPAVRAVSRSPPFRSPAPFGRGGSQHGSQARMQIRRVESPGPGIDAEDDPVFLPLASARVPEGAVDPVRLDPLDREVVRREVVQAPEQAVWAVRREILESQKTTIGRSGTLPRPRTGRNGRGVPSSGRPTGT